MKSDTVFLNHDIVCNTTSELCTVYMCNVLPLTPTNPKNSPLGMAKQIPFTALFAGVSEQPAICLE